MINRSPSSWRAAFAGALALCALSRPAAATEAMTFRLASIGETDTCRAGCADVIAAEGAIENDTADRFVAFLADHVQDPELRPVILLQSPGGTVVGAMQLGTVFRKIGAAVIVAAAQEKGNSAVEIVRGACLSACVYAFMGGKRRVVPPVSRLGIHRMVINETVRNAAGESETQHIYGSDDIVASLSAYTRAMGVDPRVIGVAETIPPDSIHIVTAREIARWRLGRPRL